MIKKCKICNKSFNAYRLKMKYCSNACKFKDAEYNTTRGKKQNKNNPLYSKKCKKCKKIYIDINNVSGALTRHIKKCCPDIALVDAFETIDSVQLETISCPLCDWKTVDITNKTGQFTIHLKKIHNTTLDTIANEYPTIVFPRIVEKTQQEKEKYIQTCKSYQKIKCNICGKEFKRMMNTHLKSHNITRLEYVKQYGTNSMIKSHTMNCKNCGKTFSFNATYVNRRKYCSEACAHEDIDFPKSSLAETELINLIYNADPTLEIQQAIYPIWANGKQIDIFIPTKNIAIEYNGLYWHSHLGGNKDITYHLDKTIAAETNNIQLVHIFSDEWANKQEIVTNILLHKLGISTATTIYARELELKQINVLDTKEFLNGNHIQGFTTAQFAVGGFLNGELVSVMIFSKDRIISKQNEDIIELVRFANCMQYKIPGAFSRLLKYAISQYNISKLKSYADRRWTSSIHNVYLKNGFKLLRISNPGYWYIDATNYNKRYHRFTFNKAKLVAEGYDQTKTEWQIMLERGYDKIYDCGQFVFEYAM